MSEFQQKVFAKAKELNLEVVVSGKRFHIVKFGDFHVKLVDQDDLDALNENIHKILPEVKISITPGTKVNLKDHGINGEINLFMPDIGNNYGEAINNIFNEFVNVHLPTYLRKKTVIGNNNYFMNSTTIDHDCVIENNVILSSNTILGGNIVIMNNAQLGMKTTVHQNQIIGSFSMIGMNSMITKKLNVVHGYTYYGKPAKKIKKNLIGLKRNKISSDILKKEYIRYLALKNEKKNSHTSSL